MSPVNHRGKNELAILFNKHEVQGHRELVSLVNWCFEPGQPLGIISGLRETFIERYIVEETNKAELRPQETE